MIPTDFVAERHMNRTLFKERNIIYYNEVEVDNCYDSYSGKYKTFIYTYISEYKILGLFKIRQIHQSIPYIYRPTIDAEHKTNIILKEAARKEYYLAILTMNEAKNVTHPVSPSEEIESVAEE